MKVKQNNILLNGLICIKLLYCIDISRWKNENIYHYLLNIINFVNNLEKKKFNNFSFSNEILDLLFNYSYNIIKEYAIQFQNIINYQMKFMPIIYYKDYQKNKLRIRIVRDNQIKFYDIMDEICYNINDNGQYSFRINYELKKSYLKSNPNSDLDLEADVDILYLTNLEAYLLMRHKIYRSCYIHDEDFDHFFSTDETIKKYDIKQHDIGINNLELNFYQIYSKITKNYWLRL